MKNEIGEMCGFLLWLSVPVPSASSVSRVAGDAQTHFSLSLRLRIL